MEVAGGGGNCFLLSSYRIWGQSLNTFIADCRFIFLGLKDENNIFSNKYLVRSKFPSFRACENHFITRVVNFFYLTKGFDITLWCIHWQQRMTLRIYLIDRITSRVCEEVSTYKLSYWMNRAKRYKAKFA